MTKDKNWKVIIESKGRAGFIYYHEGAKTIKLDWEFGAYDVLAIIWGPESTLWDRFHPWAKGRKKEILRRMADEVIKQQAPHHWADIDFERTLITIRKLKAV